MSSMKKRAQNRADVLQGTLDMLILRTLLYGPAHGHQIGKQIQRTTNDFLQMQHGSLYPALHRLEKRGWLEADWGESGSGRPAKFYKLSRKGRKQLAKEETTWQRLSHAIALVLQTVD